MRDELNKERKSLPGWLKEGVMADIIRNDVSVNTRELLAGMQFVCLVSEAYVYLYNVNSLFPIFFPVGDPLTPTPRAIK